jgi:hypothetical protein
VVGLGWEGWRWAWAWAWAWERVGCKAARDAIGERIGRGTLALGKEGRAVLGLYRKRGLSAIFSFIRCLLLLRLVKYKMF